MRATFHAALNPIDICKHVSLHPLGKVVHDREHLVDIGPRTIHVVLPVSQSALGAP